MAMWPLNIFPSFIVPLLLMAHIAVFLQLAKQRRPAANTVAGATSATAL
jgi:hypothetical protein